MVKQLLQVYVLLSKRCSATYDDLARKGCSSGRRIGGSDDQQRGSGSLVCEIREGMRLWMLCRIWILS